MSGEYLLPLRVRLTRTFLRPVFRLIFYAISRVVITGKENVPPRGAYLVALNHVSLYEAPFICAFWPAPLEALGAADIWDRPGQGILARLYGGIPVHRGQYDRRLLEIALSVLNSGYPLVLAPEGERSHIPGMQPAHPGIAYLIEKARVPVIPVGIVGSTEDFLQRALNRERPSIEMHIGRPLELAFTDARGTERRNQRRQITDQVMVAIAALLPPDYRGYYLDYDYD